MINFDLIQKRAHEQQERMKPCCQVDNVIVDMNNLLYRVGHAENHNHNRMVIVALEKLVMLRNWYGAKRLHVVWEGKGVNWRLRILPEYKGTRAQDTELRAAVKITEFKLRNILKGTTFLQWDPVDAEGDDGFGALASALQTEGETVGIYSTDRDLLQLASSKVTLIIPRRGETDMAMTEAKVVEKLGGLAPCKIPDLKGLEGDIGDNIPGIKGIGEKQALALIQKHSSLENLIKAVHSNDVKRGENETGTAYQQRLKDKYGLTESKLDLIRRYSETAKISKEVGAISTAIFIDADDKDEAISLALSSTIRRLGDSNYLQEHLESFRYNK